MSQNKLQELKSTWIGKGEEPKLEPRILIENPDHSYGELLKEATHKYCLLVRNEGNRLVKRQIEHYNLDIIIAIDYRQYHT